MISKVVSFLGEKLLDKVFDRSFNKAMDCATRSNLIKEFDKLKENIVKELQSENKEEIYYEELDKFISESRIIDLIFSLSYIITNLMIEERRKCLIEYISDYFKNRDISEYSITIIKENILSKFEDCFGKINNPNEESRKIINCILSQMTNSNEIIVELSNTINKNFTQIKEELDGLRSKLLKGDVDIDYLSELTKNSLLNLGGRFNKEFNVDVDLTDILNRFCLTRETTLCIYKELKDLKNAIKSLSSLSNSDLLVRNLDILIGNILDDNIFDYTLMKSEVYYFSEIVDIEIKKKYEEYSEEYYKSDEYINYRNFEIRNSNLGKYREAFISKTLIVTGCAGIGKSHSIAHFCNEAYYLKDKICVFILGQHLNELINPVEMIEKTLHIPYTLQRFLGELDKIAESNKTVIPFVVEGINEGRSSEVWREAFNGIISIFKSYKWIKLIISIRTTYIEKCFPEDYTNGSDVLVVEHKGFENDSIEAVIKFFEFYKIPVPTFPILYVEYYNPLFLHTLCKTLKNIDNKIITEYSSFNNIFDRYLDVVESNIALKMKYRKALRIVKRVTDKLIEYSLENNNRYGIEIEIFYIVVQEITDKFSLNCSVLVELLFEDGLFYSEIYGHEMKEYVQFSYERYHNMITARYILNKFSDKKEIISSLNNGILKKYVEKPYSGITEELFIMIPDKFSIEVLDLLDEKVAEKNLENYINSLVWRNKSNILIETTRTLINKYVVINKYYSNEFIKKLFILSPIEEHPLNILFLQEHLEKMNMAIRDSFLSEVLYDGHALNITLRNLVNFCFTRGINDCSEESIKLMSYMLAWSLSSTNLTYRNSVVRALVVLFENSIELIINVITNFKNINDPYIKEGIYCAVYGAVLRVSKISSEIEILINEIYNDIFNKDEVYPNVLVRDYARGAIEYANIIGIEITFNLEEIRPPYKSNWYKDIPAQEEIDEMRYDYKDNRFDRRIYTVNKVIDSMTTNTGTKHMMYGDFGRYVFEGWVRPWKYHFVEQELSNIATKEIFTTLGYKPELHGDFDIQVSSYNRHYNKCERIGKKYQRIASYELIARLSDNFPAGDVEYVYSNEYMNKNGLEEYLAELYEETEDTEDVNSELEKDLYDDIVFDEVEGEKEKNDKEYPKKVFNEYQYDGPWQIGIRGVDPTVAIKSLCSSEKNYLESVFNIPNISDEKWASGESSEPNENEILFFEGDDEDFVVLEMYNSWYSDEYRLDEKPKTYFVKAIALLVDREKANNLMNNEAIKEYCSNGNNYEIHDIYAREFPWAPSYISFKNEIKNDCSEDDKCYIETGINYYSPYSNPNNDDDGVSSFSMPSEFIIEKLGLKQIEDGKWYDKGGKLVVYDMIFEGYRSMLVINKNSLLNLLDEKNLAVLWAMYTEKEGGKYHYGQRKIVGWIENKFEKNIFNREAWISGYS